ncbi:MAG: uroporphyrinogen-III synthase [Planctomycetes bacterium]|nr:uroporphyrinogen-III synthase [Planctomycetota bacterium]
MNAAPVLWIGRAQDRAARWSDAAQASGWQTQALPLIQSEALPISAVDQALLSGLGKEDTLFLTSVQAVKQFQEFITLCGGMPSCAVAVVGPATAKAAAGILGGREPDFTAPQHTGESLAELFLASKPSAHSKRVFFGAKHPNPDLGGALAVAGLPLIFVAAYHVLGTPGPPPPSGELVLLFSPSGVASLLDRVEQVSAHPVLAVGPTTAAAAERNGFPLRGTLASPTPSSLTAFLKQ